MKILVVDDEIPARERLSRMIRELEGDQWSLAETAENGQQAVEVCHQQSIDIVLMDIRMPVMDGLEAAAHLAELTEPPAVIFTTAYGEYALDAFEANGAGYLLKPIKKQDLEAALIRAGQLNRVQIQTLSSPEPEKEQFLSGSYKGGLVRVPLESVIYLMAEQKYVTAHTDENNLLLDDSLKSLEQRFPDSFTRIHRNALVATDRIVGLEKKGDGPALLILKGSDQRLDVSRRHLADIKQLIKVG